jgi:hypothetical protein
MGWDKGKGEKGIGDKQFSNWLKMIGGAIPEGTRYYDVIAYREILYLAYAMHEGGGYQKYLKDRKKRLGL